jgi:zinc protease
MKNTAIVKLAALLLVLSLVLGCGTRVVPIDVSADGYGKTTLSNGITVLVNRDETTSLSAGRILIGGGLLTENAKNSGISNLMINLLLKGNDAMTAAEITEQLDFLGASVSVDCFRDYSAVSFSSLTENFDQTMEIISRSLIAPTFPKEELVKLKHEVEGSIKATDDNQSAASSKLFWKTAYGDHGYGLPYTGTIETIAGITVDDIREHYQKYVGGKNIVASVATDLPADRIAVLVQKYLGVVRPEAETAPAPKMTLQKKKDGFISFDRNQSFVFMGFVFDRLQPAEVANVVLLNEIMGNNVGSRLWDLRQKEKLAYAVYTQYAANKYDAIFRAGIGTDTSKVQQALKSLNREWDKLIADGITADELAAAKVNMKNNLIYRIDRKSGRANNMATDEYLGYGYRFVLDLIDMADQVTIEQVNSFIKEQFSGDRKYLSIVGKK